MRLNINLNAKTLEEVTSKMLKSHLQMIDLLTEDLRFAGAPEPTLSTLLNLRIDVALEDPSAFNVAIRYKEATNHALQQQSEVFELLQEPHVWLDDLKDTSRYIIETSVSDYHALAGRTSSKKSVHATSTETSLSFGLLSPREVQAVVA